VSLRGDRSLVQNRLDIVEENFRALDEIQAEGKAAYDKQVRNFLAAKHALLEATEAALDVGNHLIAANGFRRPANYADIFRVLAEAGVLPDALAGNLESMARFRNLLVHQYAAVDRGRVWAIVTGERKDILRFFESVLASMGG